MSYRTVRSEVFPQAPSPVGRPNKRVVQDYTAIHVDDPHEEGIAATPPTPEQRTTRVVHHVSSQPQQTNNNGMNAANGKLDTLVMRQDQLLSHQQQLSSRQDELASHLANQNNAMNANLLRQILANKDSMIANLASQGSEWEEHTRDLLSQHIRYITAIVQRLNMDLEAVEAELRGRDIAVVGTNRAVNKLEVHHVTMLQDLRSRIVRCDGSIAKHSKDIMLIMDELRRLEAMIQGVRERMSAEIHRLEAEVIAMTGELERQAGEQRSEVSHFRSDANHRIAMLEDKQRVNMAQLNDALEDNRAGARHMLDKMEAKFQALIDKATSGWGDLMGKVDRQIDANMMSFLSRLKRLEDEMARQRHASKQNQQNIETQVMATLQETIDYNNAELTRAKMEFRNGFTEIQDSLANMKRVVEGRRKILANNMRKELGQVKQAMYMELPSIQPESNTIIFRDVVDKSDGW